MGEEGARATAAWGEPPWRTEVRPDPEPLPTHCDVVVVGAGFTGLAAAGALAEGGARVAVLEADRIGSGASGHTGGIALEGTHAGALPGMERCLAQLAERTRALGIDCALEEAVCLELAHREPGARSAAGLHWSDDGRVLVAVGEEPCSLLDPGRLLSGLARAARESGASLHERAPVVPLRLGDGALAVDSAQGRVTASAVVVAANAWAPELVPLSPEPVAALNVALCTVPLAPEALADLGLPPSSAFYTADLPYLWGRAATDGRFLVGGGLVPASPGELRTPPAGAVDERLDALARRVRGLHPALAEVAFEARWAGPLSLLRGRPPFLGRHPDDPRVLVAGGYTGHGVSASLVAGEWLARAILHDEPLPDWGALDPTP